MAPDYEHMCLMQKIEVFEYALDNTTGQDLYRVLWLKSKNSEAWLDRRSNYSRSLAVMSMVRLSHYEECSVVICSLGWSYSWFRGSTSFQFVTGAAYWYGRACGLW